MYVTFSRTFQKKIEKVPQKIKTAFKTRLSLFLSEPFNKILENHPLKGEWKNFRSINITGDWRAVYRDLGDGKMEWVEFVEIGTHSELFK